MGEVNDSPIHQRRTVVDGTGPSHHPAGYHQHQSGAVESLWAVINRTSALHLQQLHPSLCGFRADSYDTDDLARYLADFKPRARRPSCASPLLRAVAGALGAVLLAHAFFHRSAIASLAYAARGAPSIVDFGASPSAPVAPVCSHMQGGRIPVAQAGWWWRENAAQAA